MLKTNRKMNQLITVFISLLFSTLLFSQTGFYGRKKSIEIGYLAAPSLMFKSIIKVDGSDTLFQSKRRLVNSSYRIGFSKMVSNKVSLGIGYTYANVILNTVEYYQSPTDNKPFDESYNMPSQRVNSHEFHLDLKFFRNGSIGPIGRYFGFEVQFAKTKLNEMELEIVRKENRTFEGGKNSSNATELASIMHTNTESIYTFFLGLNFGRRIPITDRLFFSWNGRINLPGISIGEGLFSGVDFGSNIRLSTSLNEIENFLEGDFFSSSLYALSSKGSNFNLLSSSVFSYKRLSFQMALHYAF